ncbi:MAG: flagellar hook-basal body complex protein FliE [Hyphomonas sp.]|uniref:flagellar hook-basal body complex protein FliE n=1 Tax=Hyphomonas sp. TaxID=87 RepID=UPI0018337DA0|nr:flagellar hook-basal body complex protein FliE [Hyphomonas sp.]MBU3921797.1 flagellar hook-basal body complex protein FliE [Alphaproteobacteria bacterium]MBA3067892.1 flagellar hook-basal body complex protein FliE [Hyphomonas sp.]MBU4062448.1 flagellar hook-basal body complex protein FliE [Alphaproteobacteria bacterium]MBU4165943.1 flagellar hook-basal body complex protein FliE [Alphaproteobacteria bacterium]MBU4568085.1 flagellar hook-basal body complex protein FliE [Alphaproteobacteria ba
MSSLGFNPYNTLNTTARAIDAGGAVGKPEASGNQIAEGIGDFRAALQQAEQTAMQTAVTGADPHAMVQALSNAELMLDAVVTIRDKVVEAYQELLRMPV